MKSLLCFWDLFISATLPGFMWNLWLLLSWAMLFANMMELSCLNALAVSLLKTFTVLPATTPVNLELNASSLGLCAFSVNSRLLGFSLLTEWMWFRLCDSSSFFAEEPFADKGLSIEWSKDGKSWHKWLPMLKNLTLEQQALCKVWEVTDLSMLRVVSFSFSGVIVLKCLYVAKIFQTFLIKSEGHWLHHLKIICHTP